MRLFGQILIIGKCNYWCQVALWYCMDGSTSWKMEKLLLGDNTCFIFLEMSLNHSVFSFFLFLLLLFVFFFKKKNLKFSCKWYVSGGGYIISPQKPFCNSLSVFMVAPGGTICQVPRDGSSELSLFQPVHSSGPAPQLVLLPWVWGSTMAVSHCRGLQPTCSFLPVTLQSVLLRVSKWVSSAERIGVQKESI